MIWSDYIGIRGYAGTYAGQETFEIFQGIGGGGSSSSGDGTIIPTDTASVTISGEMWAAQDAIIQAQSDFVDDVKSYFQEKYRDLPRQDNIILGSVKELWEMLPDQLQDFIKSKAGSTATNFIAAHPEIAAFLKAKAAWVVLPAFIAYHAWTVLETYYTDGGALCDVIKKENDALLNIAASAGAYVLRSRIYTQHDESIENLLLMVSSVESQVEQMAASEDSLLAGDDPEEWNDVIDGINTVIPTFTNWIAEVFTTDESNNIWNPANLDEDGNLIDPKPVPAPPTLPDIPSNKNSNIALAYMIAKIVTHLGTEIFRRHKEHDDDTAEGLQALTHAVDQLKFNGVRFHTQHGDMVEFTSIGTVAESYDS